MADYYILDGHTPVEAGLKEFAAWYKTANRQVARDHVGNEATVSTVFLGINHQWEPDGDPLLFETMVFGGPHDGDCERCSTWAEAAAQHQAMLDVVVK